MRRFSLHLESVGDGQAEAYGGQRNEIKVIIQQLKERMKNNG